jgi:drug/metabolite transporter (DMT)-like permease
MILGLACALGAALLYGVATVAQAVAARRLPPTDDGGWLPMIRAAVTSPLLIAVVAADLVGALLHLVAIDLVPLYLAQAGIAASLPVTALVSARVLHERLRGRDWLAIVATGGGIALLAVDAGKAGTDDGGDGFVLGLYVLLVAIMVLGFLAYRGSGRASGAVLSLLAGLGYTGVTLGARVLGTPSWSWHTVLLMIVMGFSGLLAFGLYSFALQRVPAAAATAPLVLSETGAPTLVGILLLGDVVSSGAWPLIIVGLSLAMAGSIWLAGFEGRTLDRVRDGAPSPGPRVAS